MNSDANEGVGYIFKAEIMDQAYILSRARLINSQKCIFFTAVFAIASEQRLETDQKVDKTIFYVIKLTLGASL